MSQPRFEMKGDMSVAVCAARCPLFYETARSGIGNSYQTNQPKFEAAQEAYLVVEHDLFLIVILVALHAQILAIAAQRISSSLSFDAFRTRLLCPMSTALPQSIAEKSAARILRFSRKHTTPRRGKQSDAKMRFIQRRRRRRC